MRVKLPKTGSREYLAALNQLKKNAWTRDCQDDLLKWFCDHPVELFVEGFVTAWVEAMSGGEPNAKDLQ
jgi:hypothetical protein